MDPVILEALGAWADLAQEGLNAERISTTGDFKFPLEMQLLKLFVSEVLLQMYLRFM